MTDQVKIKFPKKKPAWWKELYKTSEMTKDTNAEKKEIKKCLHNNREGYI